MMGLVNNTIVLTVDHYIKHNEDMSEWECSSDRMNAANKVMSYSCSQVPTETGISMIV